MELSKPPVMEIFKSPFAADSYIDEPEQNNQTFEPISAKHHSPDDRPQFDTEKSLGRKDSRPAEIKSLEVIPKGTKQTSPKHNFKKDSLV